MKLNPNSRRLCDAILRYLMCRVFGVIPDTVRVIPFRGFSTVGRKLYDCDDLIYFVESCGDDDDSTAAADLSAPR